MIHTTHAVRAGGEENDCILEPISWMEDAELLAQAASKRLKYIDRAGSSADGAWFDFPLAGRTYHWTPSASPIGSVIRREFRLFNKSYAAAVHVRVLRQVTRAEVVQAIKATSGVNEQPTRKRGYWYLVHGD